MVLAVYLGMAGCFWWDSSVDTPETPLPGAPLELVWSLDGGWDGVVVPPGSAIVYASRSRQLVTVDPRDGSATPLGRDVGHTLRAGVHKGQAMIVSFGAWGQQLAAYTGGGEPLWTHDTTDGIDDVWPVDLDGDGESEVVVGLNGGGGVLALGAGGRLLWSDRSIGNVWNVTAGPMDDKVLRVLTTSATGEVHVFSVIGERVKNLRARCYATEIRLGDQPFVGGSGEDGSVVATLDPSGWITKVSDRGAGIGSLAAAASVPWIGVSTVGGNVYALRASTGAMDGVASAQGRAPELAWAKVADSSLLIVASRAGLRAYRVAQSRTPSNAAVRPSAR